MTINFTTLMTVYNTLLALGFDVRIEPCHDGLKVESISEGWDFAINSLTEGHRSGLVEFYDYRKGAISCLDAKEAVKLALSL